MPGGCRVGVGAGGQGLGERPFILSSSIVPGKQVVAKANHKQPSSPSRAATGTHRNLRNLQGQPSGPSQSPAL